jgi:hypothetical protein
MTEPQENYWFPAKRYGWGWGPPQRWQGWLVLIVYVALVIASALYFTNRRNIPAFVACSVGLTALFLVICWFKGERPRSLGK